YRNMTTRRYLADRDAAAAEELDRVVTEAGKKVATGTRSTVFDQGTDELGAAYLKSKELLGELEAPLVARLYLGLAMAKAVLGDMGLATGYMTLVQNLQPDRNRQSVGFAKVFMDVFDKADEKRKSRKFKVSITTDPEGAVVDVDGSTRGKSPLELDLAGGGHLVQVESEGHYRGGWIKDPALEGSRWGLTLRPIESLGRHRDTREKLLDHYFPERAGKAPPPAPLAEEEAEHLLRALMGILQGDCLLFVAVGSEGDKVRLKGAFVTSFGLRPVEAVVGRDLAIIDSVRKVVLEVSDVEKLKGDVAQERAARHKDRLDEWAGSLAAAMAEGEAQLMDRAGGWKLVGEGQKAELFAKTAGEVACLRERVVQARKRIGAEPDAAAETLDACASEWKGLGEKVRSLMAWDIQAASRALHAREIRSLLESGTTRLKELKQTKGGLRVQVDRDIMRELDRVLADAEKSLADAEKLMKKDALAPEARRLLFRALIGEAELARRLTFFSPSFQK
ncbi:MAG: PEGA domain-containing protein, partial [Deltaproteobacteria bacterium]|nr:PEGA domain-containing protein [Deltaproteobacteria bacterium]